MTNKESQAFEYKQDWRNKCLRVYPDKLIIMNAGALPPEAPVESLKTDHLSRPRNKLLAETFYYAGTGFQRSK